MEVGGILRDRWEEWERPGKFEPSVIEHVFKPRLNPRSDSAPAKSFGAILHLTEGRMNLNSTVLRPLVVNGSTTPYHYSIIFA